MSKNIVVLGSTGSIGIQALDVIAALPDRLRLVGLGAGRDAMGLFSQAKKFSPLAVALFEEGDVAHLKDGLPKGTALLTGMAGMCELAKLPEAHIIVMGISGIAALPPLLSALKAGKVVALANKESIVCANHLVKQAMAEGGGTILPVDSEQSAIFQCLQNGRRDEVSAVLLTASGGPFRGFDERRLGAVTPAEALCHPTWKMGKKITVDSATLFNKGLEVIEAGHLFDLKKEHIRVLVHPQSIVHSMVEYQDGTIMAELSAPDMRLAIQYALTWPARLPGPCRRLSLFEAAGLTFEPVSGPFQLPIELAYAALEAGGALPILYNGANEAAVPLFLQGQIKFLDIARLVERVMQAGAGLKTETLLDVLAADAFAKRQAVAAAAQMGG